MRDPVLAANTYTSPTAENQSVDNITKNIYTQVNTRLSLIPDQATTCLQVGSLISAQARTPSSLARLLHSLTLLGREEARGARRQDNLTPQVETGEGAVSRCPAGDWRDEQLHLGGD